MAEIENLKRFSSAKKADKEEFPLPSGKAFGKVEKLSRAF